MTLLHIAALVTVVLQPVLATDQTAPTATTLNGTLTGRYPPEFAQDLFLGIPYAKAPRLQNPAPWNESWEGSRSAEYFGPACYCLTYPEYMAHVNVTTVSEECLNLNIIRPSQVSLMTEAKLPVVVWFYGGAFVSGFGADGSSNTSYIVQASVAQGMPSMAVTLNYRLGFLGFPGGAEVEAEGVANLGLKDQRQALRWIQGNIAAFGGDPEKVTLWGQSAGAASIGQQIMAYGGQSDEKLFLGGIMVSGSVGVGNTLHPTRADCVQAYRTILNATNCLGADDTLACLREAPLDQLWNASVGINTVPTYWPMVDGDFIAKPPTLQLLAGEFPRDVSILAGTNNDEGLSSAQAFGPATETDEELDQLLRSYFPSAKDETIDKVVQAYPVGTPSPPYSLPMDDQFSEAMAVAGLPCGAQYRRIAAIFGDFVQIHGRRVMARKFAECGMTAYTYRFDTNPTSIPIVHNAIVPGFATHSAEYTYFFRLPQEYDMLGRNPPVANSSSHLALSHAIAAKLISYIYTGDPNSFEILSVPTWPKYNVENPSNMILNATEIPDQLNTHVEADIWREEGMALWAEYPLELDLAGSQPDLPQ